MIKKTIRIMTIASLLCATQAKAQETPRLLSGWQGAEQFVELKVMPFKSEAVIPLAYSATKVEGSKRIHRAVKRPKIRA